MGHLDILVCNHARSGDDGDLAEIDAAMLDAHWHVNTRSTLLLPKHFAEQHDGRIGGRVAWLVTDDARWLVGQVLNSEGGFRRW